MTYRGKSERRGKGGKAEHVRGTGKEGKEGEKREKGKLERRQERDCVLVCNVVLHGLLQGPKPCTNSAAYASFLTGGGNSWKHMT